MAVETAATVEIPKKKRSFWWLFLLGFVVGLGLFAGWFYALGPCGVKNVQKASQGLEGIASRWYDAVRIADSTPRIALSSQVMGLQSIKTETAELTVPACMENSKQLMIQGMDHMITGFLRFMAQDEEGVVSQEMQWAFDSFGKYSDEVDRIAKCAPLCQVAAE